jgi:predicted O-methyltransferase YrrM
MRAQTLKGIHAMPNHQNDHLVHETDVLPQQLPRNCAPMDPFFGSFLGAMRKAIEPCSSEFGLGLSLFSLAVSINASTIVEIGRFRGFSTFALAGALRFLEIGWDEPARHLIRPDVNYVSALQPRDRKLYSVDNLPLPEAESLLAEHGLSRFVVLINQRSDAVVPSGLFDLVFIDGDHSYEGCMADVERYCGETLRRGGYFVLHDYFGWYDQHLNNGSPIKRVVDELRATGRFESILIDTQFQSFVVFRKP